MPFALLIIGAFLLIAAVRGTTDGPTGLFALVAGDFTGSPNFVFWIVAILLIGAVGYIPKAKALSDSFLVLVILVLFLSKGNPGAVGGGFFSQFTTALNTTTTAAPASTPAATATAGTQASATGGTAPLFTPAQATQIAQGTAPLANMLPMLTPLTNLVQ